jgi:hypothetical protein
MAVLDNLREETVLAGALGGAKTALARFIDQPDSASALQAAFGDETNPEEVIASLKSMVFEHRYPEIHLADANDLNGASGAYDAATDTIFIAREFVLAHVELPAAVENVLLEELGHAIDARTNPTDAAGDEGAIFARLVRGESIDAAELAALKTENDHGVAMVDGRPVNVEFATDYGDITLDGGLSDWSAADRLEFPGYGVQGYELYG